MISSLIHNPKNKISIAIDARVLSMPATGTAFYIKSVVSALLKAGFKVTLVSNAPLKATGKYIKKCKVVILPNHGRFFWEQVTLLRFLNKSDFDIYWAPWNYGLPLFYRGKTKFVLSILDMIPMRFPKQHLPRKRDRVFYKLSLGIAVKNADTIIAISKASAQDFKKYFPSKNATPIHIRLEKPPAVKSKKATDKFFLYIGGVDPRKNIGSLLKAFALHKADSPNIELVLAGAGFEPFNVLIDRLDLASNVSMPGYISEEKKLQLLQGTQALIYPSSIEGYGLPVAEAILADAAVVAGDNAALREIAGDAALFVNPRQPEAIAKAMVEINKLPVRQKLSLARKLQIKTYLDPKLDTRIIKVFKDVVNEG